MVGSGLWGGNLGLEKKGDSGKVAGKIFQMDYGGGVGYAGIYGKGRIAEREIRGEGGEESIGVREEVGGG